MLYYSTYMKLKKQAWLIQWKTEVRILCGVLREVEAWKGAFWDAENVLYVDVNSSYTDIYICKNLPNYTLKFVDLPICNLYLN